MVYFVDIGWLVFALDLFPDLVFDLLSGWLDGLNKTISLFIWMLEHGWQT